MKSKHKKRYHLIKLLKKGGEKTMMYNPLVGKPTVWNKKLIPYMGEYIRCSDFENGLQTEGYIINKDGSLGFRNELRSLNIAYSIYKGEFKNYWSSSRKFLFLQAVIRHKMKQRR